GHLLAPRIFGSGCDPTKPECRRQLASRTWWRRARPCPARGERWRGSARVPWRVPGADPGPRDPGTSSAHPVAVPTDCQCRAVAVGFVERGSGPRGRGRNGGALGGRAGGRQVQHRLARDGRSDGPANRLDPPSRILTVPAPGVEGNYVLEIHATWEPAGVRDTGNSRLGRLIRRRKASTVTNSATRRVVLAVVSPNGPGAAQTLFTAAVDSPGRETEVDSLDLNRIRSARISAWGRSPVSKPGGTVWGLPAEAFLDAG